MNTMLDPSSLRLTIPEYEESGDPEKAARIQLHAVIFAYDNIVRRRRTPRCSGTETSGA